MEAGRHVYVAGPAGSGKTVGIRWACQELKRKMIFISMHSHVMADTLEGYSWLTVVDGKTTQQWAAGIIQKALESGSALVVDEFDRAPSAIQHLLNDVAQSGSYTIKEGPQAGKRINAKPGFIVCATGNTINGSTGQYSSTQIDRSTLSRFRVIHHSFDPALEIEILTKIGLNKQQANLVVHSAERAREAYKNGELTAIIGTRHLIHVAEDMLAGFPISEAWEQNCSLQQGEPDDPEYRVCQDLRPSA